MKCKICGQVYKADGKDECFSCEMIKAHIKTITLVINYSDKFNKKSKEYWSDKLINLFNNK